jgi:hypothetical protein
MIRLRPQPLPPIHPVPEYLATGLRKQWYEDVKAALQVPWMGVVTMAFAHYPSFFQALWDGVQALVRSGPFLEANRSLRALAEVRVKALEPHPIVPRLMELGYAEREIEQIRGLVEAFSRGNYPYLLLATLARMLLEGEEMAGRLDAPLFDGRHTPEGSAPLVLMEAHHADAPTRELYEDVKRTLGLPFVNTDYRALARWPSYFALAWKDLKPAVSVPGHEALCAEIHRRAVGFASKELPNPGGLSSATLRAAAERDAPLDEILQVARLFQWLLPGLVANVAFLRAQLSV